MKPRTYSIRRIGGSTPGLERSRVYVVTLLDSDDRNDWDPSDDDRTAIVEIHGDVGQHVRCERCQAEDRMWPACAHISAIRKHLGGED